MTKKNLIKKLWNMKGETIEITKNGKLPNFNEFKKMILN